MNPDYDQNKDVLLEDKKRRDKNKLLGNELFLNWMMEYILEYNSTKKSNSKSNLRESYIERYMSAYPERRFFLMDYNLVPQSSRHPKKNKMK